MEIDWTGCHLVERVPGKCSGRPVVKGTRIFAETVPEYDAMGYSPFEIQEDYPTLSIETIEALIDFARTHQVTAA